MECVDEAPMEGGIVMKKKRISKQTEAQDKPRFCCEMVGDRCPWVPRIPSGGSVLGFKNPAQVKEDILRHWNVFICEFCGSGFGKANGLLRHQLSAKKCIGIPEVQKEDMSEEEKSKLDQRAKAQLEALKKATPEEEKFTLHPRAQVLLGTLKKAKGIEGIRQAIAGWEEVFKNKSVTVVQKPRSKTTSRNTRDNDARGNTRNRRTTPDPERRQRKVRFRLALASSQSIDNPQAVDTTPCATDPQYTSSVPVSRANELEEDEHNNHDEDSGQAEHRVPGLVRVNNLGPTGYNPNFVPVESGHGGYMQVSHTISYAPQDLPSMAPLVDPKWFPGSPSHTSQSPPGTQYLEEGDTDVFSHTINQYDCELANQFARGDFFGKSSPRNQPLSNLSSDTCTYMDTSPRVGEGLDTQNPSFVDAYLDSNGSSCTVSKVDDTGSQDSHILNTFGARENIESNPLYLTLEPAILPSITIFDHEDPSAAAYGDIHSSTLPPMTPTAINNNMAAYGHGYMQLMPYFPNGNQNFENFEQEEEIDFDDSEVGEDVGGDGMMGCDFA